MFFFEVEYYRSMLREEFSKHPKHYSEASYDIIDDIYSVLSKLEPMGMDNYKELYFRVPCGTLDDYLAWAKKKGFYTEETEEIILDYSAFYAGDVRWISVTSSEYINSEGEIYRVIGLNRRPCIRIEPESDIEYNIYDIYNIEDFLKWLLKEIRKCVDSVLKGTYNTDVMKNLPYEMRVGKISRSTLWEMFPEIKKNYLELISEKDIKRFTSVACSFREPKPGRMKTMTKDDFLKACGYLYRSNRMRGYEKLSDWDLFCLHSCSHGRNDGLAEIGNSPEEFEQWMNNSNDFDWGGHKWSIVDGSSRSRIMMRPVKDKDGWYFELWGGELYSTVEVANGYLALADAGFPVSLHGMKLMAKKLMGHDSVGIIPEDIYPVHCYDMFPDEHVVAFMNMSDIEMTKKEKEEFICRCIWYPTEYAKAAR